MTIQSKTLVTAFELEDMGSGEDPYCDLAATVDNQRFQLAELLECGQNCVLVGPPGAGKTTSLKHYASQVRAIDPVKLVIYTSLHKIAACTCPLKGHTILAGLIGYLSSINNPFSAQIVDSYCLDHPSLIILDGLDDAISEFPWVVDALIAFADYYPRCQLITASRNWVANRIQLPFLSVQISPLTAMQKTELIEKKLSLSPGKARGLLVCLGKNQSLQQVTANPLAATLLCVLCQNDRYLPRIEAVLYQRYLEVLCGHYDVHKGIKSMTLEPRWLLDVARVIAFAMYIRNKAHFDKAFALEVCLPFFMESWQQEMIKKAIDELIEPAQILVRAATGEYEFAHLCIQQFLASEELVNRRNINLVELLKNPRWDPVLLLLAQHAREIESVITAACQNDFAISKGALLAKMLACRSQREQMILGQRIAQAQNRDFGGCY